MKSLLAITKNICNVFAYVFYIKKYSQNHKEVWAYYLARCHLIGSFFYVNVIGSLIIYDINK